MEYARRTKTKMPVKSWVVFRCGSLSGRRCCCIYAVRGHSTNTEIPYFGIAYLYRISGIFGSVRYRYPSLAVNAPTRLIFVVSLSLGKRLVNLLPVAQRTNAFTNGVVDRPWVVGREFESHVHHENAF